MAQQQRVYPDPNNIFGSQNGMTNMMFPMWNDQRMREDFFRSVGLSPSGRHEGNIAAKNLIPAEYYNLANQYGFYNSLQPMARNAVSSMLANMGNPSGAIDQFRKQASAGSQSTLQGVLQRLRSGGAGIGAMQGAQLAASNQANAAGNQFAAQQYSPAGQSSRLNQILGVIAKQSPNLNNLGTLHGITTGTPRNPTGAEVLAGLL